jgi:hypothetical protein
MLFPYASWPTRSIVRFSSRKPPKELAPKSSQRKRGGHAAHADEDVPVAERIHEGDVCAGYVLGNQPSHTEQSNRDEGWRHPASTRWRLDFLWPRRPLGFLLLLLDGGLSRSRLGHRILLAVEVGSVVKNSGRDLRRREGIEIPTRSRRTQTCLDALPAIRCERRKSRAAALSQAGAASASLSERSEQWTRASRSFRCERRRRRRIPRAMREQRSKSRGAQLSQCYAEPAMLSGGVTGVAGRLLVRLPRQFAHSPD